MNQSVGRHAGGASTDVEQKPLITAILVTRNKESYIRECLVGLMDQTMADRMEVIAVDLGSEQSEWSVLADLGRSYKNLISLRLPAGKGTGAALNLATRIASGRYLTVLDPADRLKNDAYQLLATTLDSEPDAMAAYGDTCCTAIPHESFANHTSCGRMIWPEYNYQQLSQPSQVAPHVMWRRILNDTVGEFDERHDTDVMRDFLLRTSERFRMVHVNHFTGLTLVAAGTHVGQAAPQQETAVSAAPVTVSTPTPAPAMAAAPVALVRSAPTPASAPAPAPAVSADDAYGELETLLQGATDQQAVEMLRKHLVHFPGHALAHNDLAAFSYRLGDNATAFSHYRRAVELSPEESTFQKNLGDLCFVEGEVDEAIAIYLDLFKKSPRDTETLLHLGVISESVGQADEAESFYQRALEIEPWNPEARRRLTEMRERLAAEAALCEEDEVSVEEMYEQAQVQVAQNDLEGAQATLKRMIEIFPDFAPAYNDLAVLYFQTGEKDKALTHYEQAAALAPGNTTFQKNLADFYFVEGYDVDGAIGIYLNLLQKEPRNVETLMNLGRICTVLDRPEEAKTFYGKVTQLEPWNRDARECLTTLRNCVNG